LVIFNAMNLFKISMRVATGHIADLTPLTELKQTAEGLLEEIDDPDMQDLLYEIIESCDQGSSKAYLLMEDLQELEDELAVEGHGVPHTDYDIYDAYDNRAASNKSWLT
jgi:hypothetical protein